MHEIISIVVALYFRAGMMIVVLFISLCKFQFVSFDAARKKKLGAKYLITFQQNSEFKSFCLRLYFVSHVLVCYK